MDDLTTSAAGKPDIPTEMQDRWQRILNLMARILGVPAGAIMKASPLQIEVFLTSATEESPFQKGDRLELNSGLYCERVLRDGAPLQISDALNDPEWKLSPMVTMGITYYLGFPLLWPDGEVFGSICVFDRKDNPQATQFREWVSQLRQLIENDLFTLVETGKREELLAQLQHHRDHLKEMVAEKTAELERKTEELEDRLRFEDLISELSAVFVNVPPDQVEDEIASALNKLCLFFKADHCGLVEVPSDRKQVLFVDAITKAEMQRNGRSLDVAQSQSWAYLRLVEQGEPIVFSSLEALPPEASEDRVAWQKEGVQALLALPLRIGAR